VCPLEAAPDAFIADVLALRSDPEVVGIDAAAVVTEMPDNVLSGGRTASGAVGHKLVDPLTMASPRDLSGSGGVGETPVRLEGRAKKLLADALGKALDMQLEGLRPPLPGRIVQVDAENVSVEALRGFQTSGMGPVCDIFLGHTHR